MLVAAVVMASSVSAGAQTRRASRPKLDAMLSQRAVRVLSGRSRVIVEYKDRIDSRVLGSSSQSGKRINARLQAANVDNRQLLNIAGDARVARVTLDHPAWAQNERVGVSTGAALAKQQFNVTGKNIGIAVIDSGIATYHDDLYLSKGGGFSPRLAHYKDFTESTSPNVWISRLPSDDYGHGTHVAGIIAGTGYDSRGDRAGVAPGSKIVALKVLDSQGNGYISDVIAAIDYAISVRSRYNIRIINLSVASGVFESYANDPLTLAARRAVDAGIVVVAAAGNLGKNPEGETQFGGITSPGNAPWVLTVGASSHQGTGPRGDDVMGGFSSRGPTWINFSAKPDLVAYGVGIESLTAPGSTMYEEKPQYLLSGSVRTLYKPYLSLSGTSMATPVVSGTVALMLEANPDLTPNAVKALLQYTAQVIPDAHALSQGAGMLNAKGAIRLAEYFQRPTRHYPQEFDVIAGEQVAWAEHVIWGNYRVTGGNLLPGSSAWAGNQQWGALATPAGNPVIWGASEDANIVWSVSDDGNIVWSVNDDGNIVWSVDDDADSSLVWSTGDTGDDSNIVWSVDDDGNIVWSVADDDGNIVWSVNDDGNIVWSVADDDSNIVWSVAEVQNVVWGNDCGGRNCPQILWGALRPNNAGVWGTVDDDGNIVWSVDDDGNIVWSVNDDGNIVWSVGDLDSNIVWSVNDDGNIVWSVDDDGNIVWSVADDDGNIVWSVDDDGNIVWSVGDDSNIVWSVGTTEDVLWAPGS
jgi:subtilisin family serine protease